jgi:hypothetical protein
LVRKIENPQGRILDRAKVPEGVRFAAAVAGQRLAYVDDDSDTLKLHA